MTELCERCGGCCSYRSPQPQLCGYCEFAVLQELGSTLATVVERKAFALGYAFGLRVAAQRAT